MDELSQAKDQTIFRWTLGPKGSGLLGLFLLTSFVIHVAGFYLFQVVYPTPTRVDPVPVSVTLVTPGSPGLITFFQQIEDRRVHLRPASATVAPLVKLSDHSARFRPSFLDRGVEWIPLPRQATTAPSPELPPLFSGMLDAPAVPGDAPTQLSPAPAPPPPVP
ncbi:MAG: hypothetical protein H7A54_10625 [Akkermansiaceae bacterium]|nr:hypothetical protein [Akkermansiaceae bacterium]